jgi:hypothetical protein
MLRNNRIRGNPNGRAPLSPGCRYKTCLLVSLLAQHQVPHKPQLLIGKSTDFRNILSESLVLAASTERAGCLQTNLLFPWKRNPWYVTPPIVTPCIIDTSVQSAASIFRVDIYCHEPEHQDVNKCNIFGRAMREEFELRYLSKIFTHSWGSHGSMLHRVDWWTLREKGTQCLGV